MGQRRRVAVIGSGVSGLVAAHVAAKSADVTLYEADDRLGGHADTHTVEAPGGPLRIDTGFIVHNERTYPVLLRLFAELGIATQDSEMSLSVRDDATGLEWAGALGPRGLFPTPRNLARPAYLRMLTEIPRFHRRAGRLLDQADSGDTSDQTLRDFLREGGFTPYFLTHFMEPLVAAVWSCDPETSLDYPARYLFSFLRHHGMLSVFGSPTWRTVTGGSHEYVDRVAAGLQQVRLDTKVTSVLETDRGVEVTDGNGEVATYDAVVVATHPAQALAMLAEPTAAQREVLAAIPYSRNVALLHTDTSLLPEAEGARASWNFLRPAVALGQVTVTYDLTRLQRLPTPTHYLVTLGGEHLVDPESVIARREYEHPLYTPESVAAQRRLPEIDTRRITFAGAYHGWGFHEDGARSGLAAIERLGFEWDEPVVEVRAERAGSVVEVRAERAGSVVEVRAERASKPLTPTQGAIHSVRTGVYDTTIRHTRRSPFRRTFVHRSHTWLVDLDELPDHGRAAWLRGSFEARDHLGDADRTIRHNVESFLARHDVALGDGAGAGAGRILMAAHPRALGYCFNPISVFWCFDDSGRLAATVVEVHNTYGDRHAYLVHPDEQGRARTDKQMYVSPFHGTDGTYDLAVPVPDDRLRVAVTLRTDDGEVFSASMDGCRGDASAVRAAPAALRGAALIRMHGIWLWLRRLPVRPRPTHHQEGV
ncbi:FAD-dependent oxidoreductase [Nocardioides sp. GCM10027113]|uniref:FAD-dependent oxidoreductase n=1 Tax=unclassified Nocardioides TaxID=2615069 RepID=UPI0036211616